MKVSRLIEILEKYNKDDYVMVAGYEGDLMGLCPGYIYEDDVVIRNSDSHSWCGAHVSLKDTFENTENKKILKCLVIHRGPK